MNRNIFAHNADKYVSLGWSIFPLAEGEKLPMKGSDGFKAASADRTQIGAWQLRHPNANIAVATGAVSGIIVVDFDPRSGCDLTVRTLAEMGKKFPDTVISGTPRSGHHRFYAYDPRVCKSAANRLGHQERWWIHRTAALPLA